MIRIGAADGTGAEYKITGIVSPGFYAVEHLKSTPSAADEQEYAFTFLQSFDPAGLATIQYVDAQDDLKLNLTGGTLTNRLFFERGSGGANMVISPNSGDVNTAIYALNGGYLRFRSSLTEDLNAGTNTHITFGRNPDTNSPQTNIYHLQYPSEPTHAASMQYVDDKFGSVDLDAYLPLTGGTITGPLTLESNQNFMVKDANGVENFRIQANGFCRTTDLFRSQRDDGGPALQCRIGTALNAEIRCDGKATFKNDVTFRDGGRVYVNRDSNEAIIIQQSGTTKGKIWADGTFETEKTTFGNKNLVTKQYVDDEIAANALPTATTSIKGGVTSATNSGTYVPCTKMANTGSTIGVVQSTNTTQGVNYKGQACVTSNSTPSASDYQQGALVFSTSTNSLYIRT